MRQIDRKRKKEKGGKRGKRDKKTEINRESILNTQSKRQKEREREIAKPKRESEEKKTR